MPGPFYDTSTRLKLRLSRGTSEAKDIATGIHALGEDIDALDIGSEDLLQAGVGVHVVRIPAAQTISGTLGYK